MAGIPLIVSLWGGKNRTDFLCSGLLLSPTHILTVRHAFENWEARQPVYVRLIDGLDQDVEAELLGSHPQRDAALLTVKLAVPFQQSPNLAIANTHSFDGCKVVLRVVDPDSFARSTLSSHSIGNTDHKTQEYVLTPQNARGHSGGVVEIDGLVVGLLSRRTFDDPLCRAVPIHLLSDWLKEALGEAKIFTATPAYTHQNMASDRYVELLGKVRQRVACRLQNLEIQPLAKAWSADPLANFDTSDPAGQLKLQLSALHQRTIECTSEWKRKRKDRPQIKASCLFILSELVRLAVNPSADISAEVTDGNPDHLYLACQFPGTTNVIFCALQDLPHLLDKHEKLNDITSDKGIWVNDPLMPEGLGSDLEQAILRKLWGLLMRKKQEDIPARIVGNDLDLLLARIGRYHEEGKRYFLATEGPPDWRPESEYVKLSGELRLGLVFYEKGVCSQLLLQEAELIDRIRDYVELFEDF